MPTIRYRFTGPNNFNADFTITTEQNTRTYTTSSGSFDGFAITGISGTVNGQAVSLKPSSNQGTNPSNGQATNNPQTADTVATGGGTNNNIGSYDNVYWPNDSQGAAGYSNFGLDGLGIGLTQGSGANAVDYKFFNQQNDVEQFQYRTTNSGGTNVTSFQVTQVDANGNETPAPCYVTGTRILTTHGEVRVEDLAVGDLAVTASGQQHPIRWIGHQSVRCRGRADLLPVRIAAGAFGEGRPARDLMVSPGHAICVDLMGEVLIPACRLVNGTTVTQVEVDTITYWHVELDSHDILLAEGLPAESYLDTGNRSFFSDTGVIDLDAQPDLTLEGAPPFCRPFHEDGMLVEIARQLARRRAEAQGWTLVERAAWSGVHLEVDGQVIAPSTRGLQARFTVPAGAREVALVCPTSVPAHIQAGDDHRALGLCLSELIVDDGFGGLHPIALDDARLGAGLYELERTNRWTAGRVALPALLWSEAEGEFFLRLTLATGPLQYWMAPAASEVAVEPSEVATDTPRLWIVASAA